MNSPFDTINTQSVPESYWKPWLWIVFAIFAVAVAVSAWNWSRWATSPWWSDRANATSHFWDLLKPSQTSLIDPGALPTQPTSENLHQATIYTPETWCFVGEDQTGRWCVKVPTSHSCDPNRSFESRSACEMVNASAMPLGILQNGGLTDKPLSAIPSLSNNTVV
jgi:hypothetical protein